jgi:hypothetical protein
MNPTWSMPWSLPQSLGFAATVKAQKRHSNRAIGKSRGGFTSKILALTDALGNLVRFVLLPGQRYDTAQHRRPGSRSHHAARKADVDVQVFSISRDDACRYRIRAHNRQRPAAHDRRNVSGSAALLVSGMKSIISAGTECPPRKFTAEPITVAAPNQVWLADITYPPTAEGCLYLAMVLDMVAKGHRLTPLHSRLSHRQNQSCCSEPGEITLELIHLSAEIIPRHSDYDF